MVKALRHSVRASGIEAALVLMIGRATDMYNTT